MPNPSLMSPNSVLDTSTYSIVVSYPANSSSLPPPPSVPDTISTLSLSSTFLNIAVPSSSPGSNSNTNSRFTIVVAGSVAAVVLILLGIVVLVVILMLTRKRKAMEDKTISLRKGTVLDLEDSGESVIASIVYPTNNCHAATEGQQPADYEYPGTKYCRI